MEKNPKISPKDELIILQTKKLSTLLRGIASNHHSYFSCLNCLHSVVTEKKLESHKKVCENKDFCNVTMNSEDTKILEFNQYQKFDQSPSIIYTDLECIIEKIDGLKIIVKIFLQQN